MGYRAHRAAPSRAEPGAVLDTGDHKGRPYGSVP